MSAAGNGRAGRMRSRITIEQPSLVPDGMGGFVKTWMPLAGAWAEIIPLGGGEAFASGRLEARKRYRVLLRERADITVEMRLVQGTRIFNIRAVIDRAAETGRTELLAEEGVAV